MDVLILTKRQYMRRDLIDDSYGRFYELAVGLASLQNNVTLMCLSYQRRVVIPWENYRNGGAKPVMVSHNLFPGITKYISDLRKIAREKKPDCILCCSDAFHVIIGAYLGKKWDVPVVADLYDNFESYSATRIPGVSNLFRRALTKMAGITCISKPLQTKLKTEYGVSTRIIVLENAVSRENFRPLSKAQARKYFRLDEDATIIGTMGAIQSNKDIDTLLKAFYRLSESGENFRLVLAGRYDDRLVASIPSNVVLLGDIEYEQVPQFIASLDVGVVSLKNDPFGKYCFPQKACEFMACGVPIVAGRVGAIAEILSDIPRALYAPGDWVDLMRAIEYQLENRALPGWQVSDWDQQAETMYKVLYSCINEYNALERKTE
jgi:glycosyltransferase involved in cell wall biosynthesis